MIKILNLYAGIGGNRKLWHGDIEVTAVEYDREIAKIYKQIYPSDNLIVTDAHQYLLTHYNEFDFIWSSPPKFRCHHSSIDELQKRKGFDLFSYSNIDKRLLLRNCVEPELGLHIFNCAFKMKQVKLDEL